MTSVLPHRDDLVAVCRRGAGRDDPGPILEEDPVLDAAAELALLHRRRMQAPSAMLGVLDVDRDRLIALIDNWTSLVLPAPASHPRTQAPTLGEVIDRLARETAFVSLTKPDESDAERTHSEDLVDALAQAYADLADELLAGTRCLPYTSPITRTPRVHNEFDAEDSDQRARANLSQQNRTSGASPATRAPRAHTGCAQHLSEFDRHSTEESRR